MFNSHGSGSITPTGGSSWRLVTDGVMGGKSKAELLPHRHQERDCLRLRGTVSTANNGGFVQMALDLATGEPFDASEHSGLELLISGNSERYNVHLRTADLRLPWQSYRANFTAEQEWQTIRIPFSRFESYRTTETLRLERLVRIGLVAIGREFEADFCLASLRFYRDRKGQLL